jgi:transcriptional regulator GlxA family with amidase domain
VCSVCSGAFLLAEAGLLAGRAATTHWLVCRELARRYPDTAVEPDRIFVRDGNVYASAGVSAGIDLALWLAGEISGRERAEIIQLTIEYDPRPPFDAGHPGKATESVRATATAELLHAAANLPESLVVSQVSWRDAIESVRGRGRD